MNVVAMRPKPEAGTFDELWFIWPPFRRDKKAVCRQMFEKITGEGMWTRTMNKDAGEYVRIFLRAAPEEIVAGAKRYDERMRCGGVDRFKYKDEGKYCVSLQVWLNQGRWED